MKPSRIIAIIASALLLADCSDRPEDLLFTDYFVSIQDENGSESSRVLATSNNLVKTYYMKLVSVARTEPLTVYFDIEIGDGLTKGVDFTLQDPSKDNTIKIRLTSTSDPSVRVGRPGPKSKFSVHTIEKYNL